MENAYAFTAAQRPQPQLYPRVTLFYYCPAGKVMKKLNSYIRDNKTKSSIEQTLTRYQAKGCSTCPLREQCHPAEGNRIIEVNVNLNRLKRQADKRILSKRGIQKRKQRCCDVELVFGQLKHNHQFKRFLLQGIDKVTIETGLLALAPEAIPPTTYIPICEKRVSQLLRHPLFILRSPISGPYLHY